MFTYYWRRRLNFDEESRQKRDISPLEMKMYKLGLGREQKDKRKHAATCATLACILVCGSLLVGLGVALTCSGVFVSNLKGNPTPWLVTGPTCIVVGVLVLLLSVEIIIKKKKVAIDDLAAGRVGKKSNQDTTLKVKALPIWRGMDKAKRTGGQGTLPPLVEDPIVEAQTVVGELACQSSSGYSSTATSSTGSKPSSPNTVSKNKALTPLDGEQTLSMLLLDPSTLEAFGTKPSWSTTSEIDGHTTSELYPLPTLKPD